MEDREEKLSKAREKLDKFRKKKQKTQEPSGPVPVLSDDGKSKASSTSSPVMFSDPVQPSPAQDFQGSEVEQSNNYREDPSVTATIAVDSLELSEAPSADQSNLASYFGSSGGETAKQFYIGAGKYTNYWYIS